MTFDSTPILLPGEEAGRSSRTRLFTINVVVTGRCNAACEYCHYYLARNRKDVAYDISDDQFDAYMFFVKQWKTQIPGKTTYRFSGGDPMVLEDRLFQLANRAYEIVEQQPFVITAGKALDANWVAKARDSAISHVYVSIENPIRPAVGAPNPKKVIRAIRELNSSEMPIAPGVCVVPNDCFKHLYDICKWFYDEIGTIPLIAEINYAAYKSPTSEEWHDLENNVQRIVNDFHDKSPLNLFSSVSPELAYGMYDPYIFELDLENSYGITADNVTSKITAAAEKLVEKNYPKLDCPMTTCNWWEFCGNTKWYWQGDKHNSRLVKLNDYCRFKRIINDAFFRALVDPNHLSTTTNIEIQTEQPACSFV